MSDSENNPSPHPSPLSFPNLALSISYEQGLRYAQLRLQLFGYGALKPFCQLHQLNYPSIINLKNDKLPQPQPVLLQRLLRSLDTVTEVIRQGENHRLLFASAQELATFGEQLASLENPPPH